jgi:hypothetical protein
MHVQYVPTHSSCVVGFEFHKIPGTDVGLIFAILPVFLSVVFTVA